MNLNIFKPGNAVKSAFEKPNILLALVLVLVPKIIAAIGYIINSAQVDWQYFAINQVAREYVLFFVLATLVFIAGMLLNKDKKQVKIQGIVSAIGLIYILGIVIAILSIIAIPLIFSQQPLPSIQGFKTATVEEIAMNVDLKNLMQAINLPVFFVFILIALALAIYWTFILYKIIAFISKRRPWLNFISLIIILIIFGFAAINI